MRLVRNSAIALMMLAGAALFAASGIEVLRATPVGDGIEVLSVSTEAPPGSMVQAVMNFGGGDLVVGLCPVNPINGQAINLFPSDHPNNRLDLRGPSGALLASVGVGGGITGGYDFD